MTSTFPLSPNPVPNQDETSDPLELPKGISDAAVRHIVSIAWKFGKWYDWLVSAMTAAGC